MGGNTQCYAAAGVDGDAFGVVAGAYTRPLFSSTRAVSDTQKHPKHPLIPLNTAFTAPTRTPYTIQGAQVKLSSERV